MNLYRVISETLYATAPILDDGTGPEEPYAIACLIAAESRSKAKWAAWRTDQDSYDGDPREMPRMSVRLVRRDVGVPAGDYSSDPRFSDAWETFCPESEPATKGEGIH